MFLLQDLISKFNSYIDKITQPGPLLNRWANVNVNIKCVLHENYTKLSWVYRHRQCVCTDIGTGSAEQNKQNTDLDNNSFVHVSVPGKECV